MLSYISRLFSSQNDGRSIQARNNIVGSLLLKGVHVILYFLLVPLTLKYLKPFEYGIWLTISSILLWMSFFDLGLGHGLRNRLVEALAKKDVKLANEYISTCFALLFAIACFLGIVSLIAAYTLNWSTVFNVKASLEKELKGVMAIVLVFSAFQFALRLINYVLLADQKPALSDLVTLLGNCLSFLLIYLFSMTSKEGSLWQISIISLLSPFVVHIITWFILFRGQYRYLRPAWANVNLEHTKSLLGLGSMFFIIQISILIMWNASNFIIIRKLGPQEVTVFGIAYRYFSGVTMVFNIVLSPFWSAYTEAYHNNDIVWIKGSINKLMKIFLLSCLGVISMIAASSFVYHFWVGAIEIPFLLTIYLGVYVSFLNWHNIFIFLINGVGKIKVQLWTNICQALLCIPINIFCLDHFGLPGAALALVIITLPNIILSPLQYYMIIYKRSTGIWDK